MPSIGGNIRAAREAAGFKKQGVFAQALGLPQPRVSDWETDRYGPLELQNLLKIAKLCGADLNFLLRGFDPEYDEVVKTLQKSAPLTSPHTTERYGEEDLASAQTAIERAIADLAAVAKRLARRQASMARRRGSGDAAHHGRRGKPAHRSHSSKTPAD